MFAGEIHALGHELGKLARAIATRGMCLSRN